MDLDAGWHFHQSNALGYERQCLLCADDSQRLVAGIQLQNRSANHRQPLGPKGRIELPSPLYEGGALPSKLPRHKLERVNRFELSSSPWQGNILPLNYTRLAGRVGIEPT